MLHRLKTAPDGEPITLAEMRAHLGINQTTDTSRDAIISARIIAARQRAEGFTRSAFIKQTWSGYLVDFSSNAANNRLALRMPLVSVTSIRYLDGNGVQQTLDTSLYLVDTVAGCIEPAYGQKWPAARVQSNSVQIDYICGYGEEAEDVPGPIKEALHFMVGQWESYQQTIEGFAYPPTMPREAELLLNPYRDMRDWF